MVNFLYSLLMGAIVVTILIIYILYLIEWRKMHFRNKWIKWGVYLILTFIPVLGLLFFKYGKKWLKNEK